MYFFLHDVRDKEDYSSLDFYNMRYETCKHRPGKKKKISSKKYIVMPIYGKYNMILDLLKIYSP